MRKTFYQMTVSQHSVHPGLSPEEFQKAGEFLLKLHSEAPELKSPNESIALAGRLTLSFFEPLFLVIAYPSSQNPLNFEVFSDSKPAQSDLIALIRTLLITGLDAVYPALVDSNPELANFPRYLIKSPTDSNLRLLIFAVFASEQKLNCSKLVFPSLEQYLRLSLQLWHQQTMIAEYRSNLSGLQRISQAMVGKLLHIDEILQITTEEAAKILGATGAAVLFPADERRTSFYTKCRWGFRSPEIPLSNALFAKAFEDFEGEAEAAVIYQGAENENFMMVPILQGGRAHAMLFFYTDEPSFQPTESRLQIAEIFGYRISLAMENHAMFQNIFESRTEWENTFDSIADPIYLIDNEFRLKKVNKSMAAVAQREVEPPANRNCYSYLFRRESICPWCPVAQAIESEEPVTVEARLFSSGLWQMQSFPYRDKSGNRIGAILVLHDITVLKRMQEQLIETEKLASMGKLISGVAHEVRNPLFGISATARALTNELGAREDIKPYLDIITSESMRLNRLMEGLLDYSRPVRIDKNPSDLSEIVQEVVDHFKQIPSSGEVTLNVLSSDRIPPINLDTNKMKQVLFNLVDNGIQHGGQNARIDIFLEYLSLMAPPQILLVIKDNGSGISPENLPRIFDPFFTTRQKGTGLGLSIVRKVVHDHGGRIAVESHSGVGTTFRISLPVPSAHV